MDRPDGFKHIIVGTSLTETSLGAMGEAVRLAARFGATLSVMHVGKPEDDALRAQMSAHLAGLSIPSGLDLRPVFIEGSSIAEAIADYAQREGGDLICVGPRARGFVEKHITGGPAEQLVTRTVLPTLVSAGPVTSGYNNVLVALDHSTQAARALQLGHALLEGAPGARQLIALHVIPARTGAHKLAALELQKIEAALLRETTAEVQAIVDAHLGEHARDCVIDARIGALGHWISESVKTYDADLVCMGTVGRSGVRGWLAGGNAAERMVRALDVPLLVAHSA